MMYISIYIFLNSIFFSGLGGGGRVAIVNIFTHRRYYYLNTIINQIRILKKQIDMDPKANNKVGIQIIPSANNFRNRKKTFKKLLFSRSLRNERRKNLSIKTDR